MKLTIKLDAINHGDVAVKLMPLLAQSAGNFHGAVGKTVAAIANLPDSLVRDIFDAIPEDEKNGIIAAYAMEYSNKILAKMNDFSMYHNLGLKLAECSIDQDMNIVAEVSKIDYIAIVDRFLPVIRDKLLGMGGLVAMFRPMIHNASAEQIVGLLDRFVGENKEAFLASLINQNQHNLITAIEDAAQKQNIHVKINSVILEI